MARLIMGVVLTCIAGLAVYIALSAWAFRDHTISHIADWDHFYATTVREFGFTLPEDVAVVEAMEISQWPMGQQYTVRFRLPETRKPDEWVRFIAERGPTPLKRHALLYEADPKRSDYRKVEYSPPTGHYEIQFGWD